MSYLTIPRLAFSGRFQADVSTVNNDVRHYDNATFEPRFQTPAKGDVQNGWWNPDGTGSFRIFDLQIHQAIAQVGDDPTSDPATGLFLNPQESRSSAKMVDLDPQMQVVSTIFGLKFVLTNGSEVFLSGDYKPTPFRDMQNGRYGMAQGLYCSVMSNLVWGESVHNSPVLGALQAAAVANDGKLSVNFMTYAFGGVEVGGRLTGSIGVYKSGDPEEFVAARRLTFDPKPHTTPPESERFGDFVADVDAAGTALSLDLAGAIPLEPLRGGGFKMMDLGEIYTAILRQTDTVTGFGTPSAKVDAPVKQGDTVSAAQLKLLSRIDYMAPNWLAVTAGIVDNPLDDEARQLLRATQQSDGLYSGHPIAIVKKTAEDEFLVVIRENYGGLYARADQFVFRVDPPVKGTAGINVDFKVTQWGQPLVQAPLVMFLETPDVSNNYWGPGPGNDPTPPQAPYPQINTPAGSVVLPSTGVTWTDAGGWAQASLQISNPGNPRGYVDGQIYTVRYNLAVHGDSPQAPLDLIVIHARMATEYSDPPDWDVDIKPFMQQYDNLYPIMSQHLFSLTDSDVFAEHATLLSLAFSLSESDPNHMPVTRDLSDSKRQAVLNWLAQYTQLPAPTIAPEAVAACRPTVAAAFAATEDELAGPSEHSLARFETMLKSVEDSLGGKNPVVMSYLSSEIARLKGEGQA